MAAFIEIFQSANWPIHYLSVFVMLAVLWAVEHFFVQASLFDCPPITRHPLIFQLIRLWINLMIAAVALLIFSRPWLVLLVGADFLLSLVVVAYKQYFHRAFSFYSTVKNFREGMKVSSFALKIIPLAAWVGVVMTLAAKLFLIIQLPPSPLSLNQRWLLVEVLIGAVMLMVTALQFTSFNFISIRGTPITRAVYVYGYLNTWIAEFFIAPDTKAVAQEVADLQRVSPDRLSATETPWPNADKIVVMQVESFGWNVLNHRVNGREVMPFLNSLTRTSRLFRIQVYHDIGTADMDYAVLSGGTPSERLVSYYVPDLAYPNALPRFMQEHGYHTVALHGGTGDFYNRRSNFERMGLDEIWFREDFHGRPVKQSYWGVRDQEVLRLSADKMRESRGREFHFIITLDSHGPFNLITEEEKEIFPGSRVWQENYFNSMHTLDRHLRQYVESLPKGTMVIMYGDHTSGVEYGGFKPARNILVEYTPCIVYVHDPDAATMAQANISAALPEDLRIHDVINVLRRQIRASGRERQGAGAKTAPVASPAKRSKTP